MKLRNYIQNTPTDAATKGNVKDYPAIVALGGVVHSLMMLMPWMEFARPERTIRTLNDPVADLQEAQERGLWAEENGIYGYGEDGYDNGELVSTI